MISDNTSEFAACFLMLLITYTCWLVVRGRDVPFNKVIDHAFNLAQRPDIKEWFIERYNNGDLLAD